MRMLKIFVLIILLFNLRLCSQEILLDSVDKYKYVAIYNTSKIVKLSQVDSITDLHICIFNIKGKRDIKLKTPELLESLDIVDPKHYLWVDSFPNLIFLRIEGNFKGEFNLKFSPVRISNLGIFYYTNENYAFIENLVHLDTLAIWFYRGQDRLWNSMKNSTGLKLLHLESKRGQVNLDERFLNFTSLKWFESNMTFSDKNLEIINRSKVISKLTIVNQKIHRIPISLNMLRADLEIVFEKCVISEKLKAEIIAIHKKVVFL